LLFRLSGIASPWIDKSNLRIRGVLSIFKPFQKESILA
jgi:hypothetical protein